MPRQPKTRVRLFRGFPKTHPKYEEYKNRVGLPFIYNLEGRWGPEVVYFLDEGRVRIDSRFGTEFRPIKIWANLRRNDP